MRKMQQTAAALGQWSLGKITEFTVEPAGDDGGPVEILRGVIVAVGHHMNPKTGIKSVRVLGYREGGLPEYWEDLMSQDYRPEAMTTTYEETTK